MKTDIWATTGPAELGTAASTHTASPLLGAKIMMVDDEPLMTDLIQTHLETEGYSNFVVTNDPRRALEMLRRESPSVVLLDLMMPQMSGFDLLQAIRADRTLRYTPVIVLTAATGSESKLKALKLGATDFLSKPVDSSELVLRVRNTLAFQQYHNRLINFDVVTGLPNEGLFDRSIEAMTARHDEVQGSVALLSITVPECRTLRESLDEAIADDLAKVLARRLERIVQADALGRTTVVGPERAASVARLGRDHFGVLFEGVDGAEGAEGVSALAERVLASLSEPVTLGLLEITPTAWIGVSMWPADGETPEALRKGADLAATHARGQNNPSQVQFASNELNTRSYRKTTLGLQLRGAAQRGELRLHYQPKLDVMTRQIIGAEALVRWQHPDHGLVPPIKFIPLAEELGLINGIGEWVIERACQDAALWARRGLGRVCLAVNVAKPQFVAGNLCASLARALRDNGLAASQLVVEFTESMLVDDMHACVVVMNELRALGVTLSIDDFGTGYSSLSYLKRFPLNELKIDRSFLADLPGASADVAIVRTIIELGHSLGMTVLAEGVETAEQLEVLTRLGCDHYQGFFFSKPMSAEKFELLLASQPAAALRRRA